MYVFRQRVIVTALMFFLTLFSFSHFRAASAQEEPVLENFTKYDQDSKIKVDHSAWTDVLTHYVLYTGRSKGRLAKERKKTYNNSHLVFGATLPSRYESNRVFFHEFRKDQKKFVTMYRQDLENLPQQVAIYKLNQNEQLAYWLNLHNVIVFEKILDKYPTSNLKRFKKKQWAKKAVVIQGVPLSLNDIENIVVKNWNFPLVIYGFYLGPIGGPNLPKEAYTGKNVYRLLEENAIEFINSNRGFKANKGKLKASLLYEWWFGLFDNSLEGLLEHLRFYAEAPFDQGLDSVKKLDFDLFDWNIADIIGGSYYSGEHNNVASSLRINSDNVETTTSIFFFRDYFMAPGPGTSHYFGDLPPAAIVLLRGIAKNKSFPDQKEDNSAQ